METRARRIARDTARTYTCGNIRKYSAYPAAATHLRSCATIRTRLSGIHATASEMHSPAKVRFRADTPNRKRTLFFEKLSAGIAPSASLGQLYRRPSSRRGGSPRSTVCAGIKAIRDKAGRNLADLHRRCATSIARYRLPISPAPRIEAPLRGDSAQTEPIILIHIAFAR